MIGGVDFSDLKLVLKEAIGDKPAVTLAYGTFLQNVVDFTIVAFAVFLFVKAINSLKRKEQAVAPEVPAQEKLLGEIRDLLKAQK